LGFLSIGAIFGGLLFIISPDGDLFQMPLSILDSSPFKDFLIPGIILFLVLGLPPAFLIYALIKKPDIRFFESLNFFKDMHWTWSFCIYISFALAIWIQAEMILLKTVFWLQSFYMGYALVMIFITLLPGVRNNFKKE
jgi:magnesium-transporting ATPase (P-type)